MSTTFWMRLEQSVAKRNSLLCVGLDPHPGRLPSRYRDITAFTTAIVDATADIACCYKPNLAFYEAAGQEGWSALRETLAAIPDDIPVILDAKRSDISTSAAAYAKALFESLGGDAATVNPYCGKDGVAPFLEYSDRGVFLLCKTSNPSAHELQDWTQAGLPLFREVARLAAIWAGSRDIGLVIGATYSDAIAAIREECPRAWFLIPGVGAQGGVLADVLRAGLRSDGRGVLINSSRGIMYADDPRHAAANLRDRINEIRTRISITQNQTLPDPRKTRLSELLYQAGCLQFGDFVLHSGLHSPVYVDLRRLASYPGVLREVALAYARLLQPLTFDRIAAVPYAAMPIGTAISLLTGHPMIYPRREVKQYGARRRIEGVYASGERVVLVDDLISTGGSKLEAMEPLREAGLVCQDVAVLIDREQGGAQDLARHGCRLHAVLTLREIVGALEAKGLVSRSDAERVRDYLGTQG